MVCNEFFKVFQQRAIKVGSVPLYSTNSVLNPWKRHEPSKRAEPRLQGWGPISSLSSCSSSLSLCLWERAGSWFGCCCDVFAGKVEHTDFGAGFQHSSALSWRLRVKRLPRDLSSSPWCHQSHQCPQQHPRRNPASSAPLNEF